MKLLMADLAGESFENMQPNFVLLRCLALFHLREQLIQIRIPTTTGKFQLYLPVLGSGLHQNFFLAGLSRLAFQ